MKRKHPNQQQSESFKPGVIDFKELTENAAVNSLKTDLLREQEKCVALSMTIDELLKKLESKEDEIMHLKQMLSSTVPVIGEPSRLILSDEEVIADIQLQKLKDNARMRELTLDEIKKFDLLVKNKRLAQGNATTINADKLPKDTSKEKLLQIAAKKPNSGE